MLINCIFSVNDVIYPDTRTQREYDNVGTFLAASLAKESGLRSFIQSFMPGCSLGSPSIVRLNPLESFPAQRYMLVRSMS